MQQDIEEQLVALESIDIVRAWHKRIVGRELNFRRANEIASSARQAREYMRNAAGAAHSVRPLLSYYGNAALSRALVLLLRPSAGEESLARGHGLETVGWNDMLSGDLSQALSAISKLRVRATAGLFQDLLAETGNVICIHARSSRVDWSLSYPQPPERFELQLGDITARLADLSPPQYTTSDRSELARVNEMSFSHESGFLAKVQAEPLEVIQESYVAAGYEIGGSGELRELRCQTSDFERALPQFTHGYVRKMFGSIPDLHLCKPFPGSVRLSQIAVTLILSFILGMMARYFPTHWIAVQSGSTGDTMWPTLFAAQRYVESAYPELLLEFISHKLAEGKRGDA